MISKNVDGFMTPRLSPILVSYTIDHIDKGKAMKGKNVAQVTFILILLALLSLGVGASPGSTWTRASLIQPPNGVDPERFSFDRVFFLPSGEGWATGRTPTGDPIPATARSQDGGQSWRFLPLVSGYRDFDSIIFLEANRGWASSMKCSQGSCEGVMLHTTNGGYTWTKWSTLALLKIQSILDMLFDSKGNGIAVGLVMPGQYGVILRTTDFGKTWTTECSTNNYYFRRIAAHESSNWVLSQDKILLGENGRNWKTVLKRSGLGLSIDAPTAMSVVAVLDKGSVVLSEDKGRTWQEITLPSPYEHLHLGAVKFADPRHGWVAGHNGVILATNDGGKTWEFESQVKSYFLRDIAIVGSKVFVVGDDGAIYWRNRS